MHKMATTLKRTINPGILQKINYTHLCPAVLFVLFLAFLLQSAGSLPPTLVLYLAPGIAVMSILATFLFGRNGLLTALAANLAAAVFLGSHWSTGGEEAFLIAISVLLYAAPGSVIIYCFKKREEANRQNLEWMSAVDSLTEVYNHRYFQQRITEEIARAKRSGRPVSLVFLDIDNFKPYNDQNGHVLGDRVLKITASYLKKGVRMHDVVCRYGGDEFVIILPETGCKEALMLAKRLVDSYEQQKMPGKLSGGKGISLSAGIASYPEVSSSKDALIGHADRALYMAKESGKGAVRSFNLPGTAKENPFKKAEERGRNDNSGKNRNKDFSYQSCELRLIDTYRSMVGDRAEHLYGKSSRGDNSEQDSANHHNRLIVGKVLGIGHSRIDNCSTAVCVEELELH